MSPAEKKILAVFKKLASAERENLQAYAEFLLSRSGGVLQVPIAEPQLIARAENESVVAAIKRLSASYPMLEKPELLNKTSALMTQHIMQGRDVTLVIDELELLFADTYQALLEEQAAAV
jgi:hypothetical protein